MVDVENMVKWIPLTFLIFAVFTVISIMYVGGLQDITGNIGEYDRGKFRLGVVMENTVTVSYSTVDSELDYEHRRGVIPEKYFTNQISQGETEKIGYAINSGKCYIPKVAGLDGENFGFYFRESDALDDASAPEECNAKPNRPHATTPLTVVSEDTKFHNKQERVTISIYEIE